ncbi:MAG: WecB/TagA/CpsF family glycosyltransferase [Acidimicrobiales bacterium]
MRFEVLGVPVDALDLDRTTELVGRWVAEDRCSYICATGVHGVMESQRAEPVMLAHRDAGLVVPDGVPLVWCGRKLGLDIGRVYGPDLMLRVIGAGVARGWRHAFYGSSPQVLDALVARLSDRFPGLVVAGTISPPYGDLSDEQGQAYAQELNSMRPDVVWVGLSTPKQELWMHRWRPALDASTLVGVGAAFDFHAGLLKQAPPLLQRHGLEWAYRLAREPRRLWRRYLRNNPAFVVAVARRRPRRIT